MERADPALLSCLRPWLVGVVHLPPLPGAPTSRSSVAEIATQAAEDARILEASGFTATLIENFHDAPFRPEHVDAETVAALAVVAHEVRGATDIPLGVNVLRNDALAALGVAVAAGGTFVRVNVLAGAAITDQGLVQGVADRLLRRRRALGAEHVAVLADVDVKHATALDTRPITERAADLARRSGADAVLVTGAATGAAVDVDELRRVRDAVAPTPVLAASGATAATLPALLEAADGVIVGTAIEDAGTHRVDRAAAEAFARAAGR